MENSKDLEMDQDVEQSNLTDWENEPTVRDFKTDLEAALSPHSAQVTKINGFLDNLNLTGTAKHKKEKGRSGVQPKLIRKQAEWRYASLSEPFLSTEDLFNVMPVTYEDRLPAIQNGLILNNQFNTQIDKVALVDEVIRTDVDEGTVIGRVGWDFAEEEQSVEVIEYAYNKPNQEQFMVLQQAMMLQQTDPGKYQSIVPASVKESLEVSVRTGEMLFAVAVNTTYETKMVTVRNQPTVTVCNFNNVIPDPSCEGVLDDARFVIYSFESSLDELEKSGKYENLDQIPKSAMRNPLMEPDHVTETGAEDFNFADEPRKRFTVYEYWGDWDIDGSGETKAIVASWVGDTMIRLNENPYPDKKHPFVSCQYLPVRRSVYGEPDGALLEDNQLVVGALQRGMIDVVARSANGQMGVAKDALDVINKRKFDQGKDYEFNPQAHPDRSFYMHTHPEIPQSAHILYQQQNAEAESLTGVTAFSQGMSGAALGDTATGVRGVLDAASKRELGILRRLASFFTQIGRKVISMNAVNLSEEEVVRITNDEFVRVRRDDLAGNFDLRLTISTAEDDNAKAQELAFMLQTMGANMDPGMAKIILSDIARLRKMPELGRRIEAFEPQPDPMAQRKAELENLLLEAQIQQAYSDSRETMADEELTRAKTVTERAKAINVQADTDKKNLDFVEQESGTNHERELQKQGEQARSNVQLKIIENALQQSTQPDSEESSTEKTDG